MMLFLRILNEVWLFFHPPHCQFFRFMAANLSCTHMLAVLSHGTVYISFHISLLHLQIPVLSFETAVYNFFSLCRMTDILCLFDIIRPDMTCDHL